MAVGWARGMKRQEKAAKAARSHADRGRRGQAEWEDAEAAEPFDPTLYVDEADQVLVAQRQQALRSGWGMGVLGVISVPLHALVPTEVPLLWALAMIPAIGPLGAVVALRRAQADAAAMGDTKVPLTSPVVQGSLVALGALTLGGHLLLFLL